MMSLCSSLIQLLVAAIFVAMIRVAESRQFSFRGRSSNDSSSTQWNQHQVEDLRKEIVRSTERAWEAYQVHDWPGAAAMYEAALSNATNNIMTFDANTYILYGLALENLKTSEAIEQAIGVLLQGLTRFPDNELMHYNLGCYYMRSQEDESQEKALMEYDWVLDRDPISLSNAAYNKALVLMMHRGDWEAAAQSLEAVIPIALSKYGKAWYEGTPWLIRQHQKVMQHVPAHPSRVQDLEDFVDQSLPLLYKRGKDEDEDERLILEFGVADGESIAIIANRVVQFMPDQVVYGFDSFVGLPAEWRNDNVGEYSTQGVPPYKTVPGNVLFEVGWFNETLPMFLAQRPNATIAALHLDADLYSSTIEILESLVPIMPPGCVVRFDEYYLLRATLDELERDGYQLDQDEARAWSEIMEKYGINAEPISWHGQSVAFRLLENQSYRKSVSIF